MTTPLATELDQAKRAIRERMKRALTSVSAAEARSAGASCVAALTSDPRWADWRSIALFSSLPGEVDLAELFRVAWAAGKRVALPCTLSGGAMEFREVRAADALERGRFGVLEPPAAAAVLPISRMDCVLVPGLAFDAFGGRLGRGAGYYDRALAPMGEARAVRTVASGSSDDRPLRIGVAFALQVVDRVPMSSLDMRMDACVTEAGWLEFAQRADSGE